MPKLSPEFIGKLPPGAKEQMQQTVESFRSNSCVIGIEVLPGPDCKVAETYAGVVFSIDSAPILPFAGCVRSPCCGCCLIPVIDDLVESELEPRRDLSRPVSAGRLLGRLLRTILSVYRRIKISIFH